MTSAVSSLRKQIAACEATLKDLRQQLAEAEHGQTQPSKVIPQKRSLMTEPANELDHDMNFGVPDNFRSEVFAILGQSEKDAKQASSEDPPNRPLEKDEYKRYGRQLIMPEIGLRGECNPMVHKSELTSCRPASPKGSACTDCRGRRSGMSSCRVPGRGRRGHSGSGRWGCG